MKTKNKLYPFTTRSYLVTTKLLDEIIQWGHDSEIVMKLIDKKCVVGDESFLIFGFKSEEDMGLFSLRWNSLLEECFQKSFIHQLTKTYDLIRGRAEQRSETTPEKKEPC